MKSAYRESVLLELARHGVQPAAETPPELVRDFINDLYRYEIRALRNEMIAGRIAKKDYARRVGELRDRYPVLALPIEYWTTREDNHQATLGSQDSV